MRGRILVPAAIALALAVPSAAAAANAWTVDHGVGGITGDGCNAEHVCKTITGAAAAVQPGDSVTIKDGIYNEPATIQFTDANVLVTAEHPLAVTVTQTSSTVDANSKPPVFSLVEGDHLNGLVINSPSDGGPAVFVKGANTTVSASILSKTGVSTRDTPVYQVDAAVQHGVNNINHSSVLSAPTAAADQASATIDSSAGSALSLDSVIVFSGLQQGPGVLIRGGDITNDGLTVPSKIRQSVIGAVNPKSSGLLVTSAGGNADTNSRPIAVEIDSTILEGGSTTGSGLDVETQTAGAGQDNSGDVAITAVHTTIAGAEFPFTINTKSSGATVARGNVNVTFDRSIVHGIGQGTITTAPAMAGILGLIGTTKANSAHVNIKASDTTQQSSPNVTLIGATKTPDSDLFVDAPHLNFHLIGTAPVIDKGGPVGQGESTLDVDGDARVIGAGSDLGADEFQNHAPIASAQVAPLVAKQGQDILFDARGSHDPDGTPIAKWIWNFGDGTTLESTTPIITHKYILLGDYFGSVTAVDPQGAASVAFQLPHIRINDGAPPTVKITAPTANKTYTLYTVTTTKSKKTGKTTKTKKLKTIKFTGTAVDEAGVANADLSLRRLNLTGKTANLKNCITTDGKKPFKTTSCKNPVFFRVSFKNGAFSYTLKPTQKLLGGTYELSARATDKNGNVSAPVTVKFKLK